MADEYIKHNKASWDERAPEVRTNQTYQPSKPHRYQLTSLQHAKSPASEFATLLKDPTHLSAVSRFDIPLLPSVAGLNIVHLQCHIATDTLSLARRGAQSIVGLDFSSASLREARRLAAGAAGGDKVSFVEGSVYDALTLLEPGSFDLVFTGIGALCWLPSIRKWAHVVASLLKPGGRLFIREAHPMVWTLDESVTDHLHIGFPYFERAEATVFENEGTYLELEDKGKKFAATRTLEWNHGMGEIVQSLLDEGMAITGLVEHTSLPWDALEGGGRMVELENGEFVCAFYRSSNSGANLVIGEYELKEGKDRIPLSYTLQAVKRA
jgi:SAM-dependent methyltransferase